MATGSGTCGAGAMRAPGMQTKCQTNHRRQSANGLRNRTTTNHRGPQRQMPRWASKFNRCTRRILPRQTDGHRQNFLMEKLRRVIWEEAIIAVKVTGLVFDGDIMHINPRWYAGESKAIADWDIVERKRYSRVSREG